MTTKEAIKVLHMNLTDRMFAVTLFVSKEACATVLDALHASQKREREVFKRLSDSCSHGRTIDGRVRQFCFVNNKKCTRRTCPLLKQKKEIK
jgi:hypothetical protein